MVSATDQTFQNEGGYTTAMITGKDIDNTLLRFQNDVYSKDSQDLTKEIKEAVKTADEVVNILISIIKRNNYRNNEISLASFVAGVCVGLRIKTND